MPKQIQTHTFGSALVAKFGLKGRFQPVLDETIVPVTIVESTLAIKLAVGGFIGTAAGAGKQNQIILSNPANSGIIVTVRRWWAVSGVPASDFVSLLPLASASSTGGHRFFRDLALAGVPTAGFNRATPNSAVLAGPQYRLEADIMVWEEVWILPENSRLEWRQNEANTTLLVWVDWDETPVTASVGA